MARIGYARVSTREQNTAHQRDALTEAGCERVFIDKASGRLASRPQLDAALDYLRTGDQLVVTRLNRLGRSMRHLFELVDQLQERGIDLVVLQQGIDTSTPVGRFFFSVMAALAELDRELIVEGTKDGLAAAKARGRSGGRPPALTNDQVAAALQMRDQVDADGNRQYSVSRIAQVLGVSRATIYRAIDTADAQTKG
jgi:DNA invertase Pin-like site-specific DNA recombinase